MTESSLLSVGSAVARVLGRAQPLAPRSTSLAGSLGLILAEPIVADLDLPPFAKALMDGYAVRSVDLATPGEQRCQVVAEILAGQVSDRSLGPGEVARIMTGAPLPPGADAVVPVEQSRTEPDHPDLVWLRISAPIRAGQSRLDQGREMRRGETLLGPETIIRAGTIGLIGSAGRAELLAIPRPSVAVIPTGDETVPVGQIPGPGQIRDTNGPLLAALVRGWGATDVTLHPSTPDHATALAAVFEPALRERDVLIISGGVSAGIRDLVPAALVAAGVEPVFHKVAVKPGKPLWFGVGPRRAGDRPGALVFGLPGNPASGVVGFLLFVRPALEALAGRGANPAAVESVVLGTSFHHRGDRPTYHPVRLEDRTVHPLPWAGSADLRTVALADGFVQFDAGDREYPAGTAVPLLRLP